MTREKPNVKATGRYTSRETCQLLGISRSTLERQTKQGNITANRHKSNMHRFYTGTEITKFWNATI